jgi:hypothetical protein
MAARIGSKSATGGLDGRDVFALAESPDGTILAGTNHGIFALAKPDKADKDAAATPGASADPPAVSWIPRGTIQNTLVKTATETIRKARHREKRR